MNPCLIRPSSLPLGAGVFFIKKKDGSLRPCIVDRGLNWITVRNKYPLHPLNTAFELLQGACIFTKHDLCNAYHLVHIRDGDEWKMGFNTHLGHYDYLVMPFWLYNTPAVFHPLINDVLRDFLNRFVFVYLDNILIFSPNLEEHRAHVRVVLQRPLENRLVVKVEKCLFHAVTVSFLGLQVAPGRIEADPEKVVELSRPSTWRKLQQFLGFTNFYQRFI